MIKLPILFKRYSETANDVIWFGLGLILALIIFAVIAIQTARECQIEAWKRQLDNVTFTLALQTSQSIDTALVVLDTIVAVTAYAYADGRSKYLSLGMDFLAKPIEINQLKKILIDWLPKHVEDLSSSATATVQTEHHEVFNKEAMLSRLGDDERLAVNITLSAIHEMPKFIDQLYTSILEGDWVKVKLITHTLKGLVAQIGGEDLTKKITHLDNHLRNGEYINNDSVRMIEDGYHALVNEMIEEEFIKRSDINA